MTGKTPASLLFHGEMRTELPSIKLNVDLSSSNVEGDARSYQKQMKSYHDRKQRAKAHSFNLWLVILCILLGVSLIVTVSSSLNLTISSM